MNARVLAVACLTCAACVEDSAPPMASQTSDVFASGDFAIPPRVAADCTSDDFTIGGSVVGLGPYGRVLLQNNGADDLSISNNSNFTFSVTVSCDAAYDVTVVTQPVGQTCSVTSGSGIVGSSAIADITVTCE